MPRQKSFTLIEVMIVVLLLGILACLAIPQFQGAIIKAKFAEMFNLVSQCEREVDLGMLETGWGQAGCDWFSDFVYKNYEDSHRTPHGFYFSGTEYGLGTTTGFYAFYIRVYKVAPTELPLCERFVGINGKRVWWIYDGHPWAKYLRQVLPQESIITSHGDFWEYLFE